MRKFIILIALAITFTSCVSKPQKQMMDILSQTVEKPTVTDFRIYKTTTLADEVTQELSKYNCFLSWYKDWTIIFEDVDTQKSLYYKEATEKTEKMIDYLESIKTKYPDSYTQVSFTTYLMGYMCEGGHLEVAFGIFNNDGEMVAFRPTGTSEWTKIKNQNSIPEFDKYYSEYGSNLLL